MRVSKMTDEEFFKMYESHQDEMEREFQRKKLIEKDDKH